MFRPALLLLTVGGGLSRAAATTMASLQVNPWDMGSGIWIAHTPSAKDWFTFIDPVDDYDWNLTPNPSDLRVAYVAVWASPNSPNY
jgi:hypothetical protein